MIINDNICAEFEYGDDNAWDIYGNIIVNIN